MLNDIPEVPSQIGLWTRNGDASLHFTFAVFLQASPHEGWGASFVSHYAVSFQSLPRKPGVDYHGHSPPPNFLRANDSSCFGKGAF